MLTRIITLTCLSFLFGGAALAQDRPNILIIWGDDIGYWNTSAYNRGMMSYTTPNIDRIAREGMMFTDAYAEQSCTAGRAAFITGQGPFRTGMTKGRVAGLRSRAASGGRDDRGALETTGLRDRSIWQEPSW